MAQAPKPASPKEMSKVMNKKVSQPAKSKGKASK